MQATMILATSLLFFALFSPVELLKFYRKVPEAPPKMQPIPDTFENERLYSPLYLGAPRYYPLPAEQQQFQQQQQQQFQQLPIDAPPLQQAPATKGGELQATKSFGKGQDFQQPQPAPFAAPAQQPASVAYLVVRPVQPAPYQQALYESNYRNNYFQQQQQQQQLRPIQKQEELAGIKGSRQTGEQSEQVIQEIEQQRQQPAVNQPALVVPVPPGKEGKLRALLDKLMSKLTLGSSYHVTGEEIVPAPVPQQPIQHQLFQQPPIEQQQQQQQKIEQVEDQRLEQQIDQQRDNGFEEANKQINNQQEQQQQQQQQIRDDQLQQSLAEQELQRPRVPQQQAVKTQQLEPIRQELEPVRQEATKSRRVLPDRLAGPQQLPISQELLRQEAKGNAGF